VIWQILSRYFSRNPNEARNIILTLLPDEATIRESQSPFIIVEEFEKPISIGTKILFSGRP
jgi:hypothetical protein